MNPSNNSNPTNTNEAKPAEPTVNAQPSTNITKSQPVATTNGESKVTEKASDLNKPQENVDKTENSGGCGSCCAPKEEKAPLKPNAPIDTQNQNQDSKNEQNNEPQASKQEEAQPVVETKESVKKIMELITLENYDATIQNARKLKKNGNWEGCLDTIEAMIKKGAILFGSQTHPKLAIGYFRLGDVLLQKLEDTNDLFGNKMGQKDSNSIATANGTDKATEDREEEIKVSWENLETARVILEKQLESFDNTQNGNADNNQGIIFYFYFITKYFFF